MATAAALSLHRRRPPHSSKKHSLQYLISFDQKRAFRVIKPTLTKPRSKREGEKTELLTSYKIDHLTLNDVFIGS